MRLRGVLAALYWTASALPSSGQTSITERDFVERVSRDHPAVRALGEDLATAEAARQRAGLPTNPKVEFEREHPDQSARQDTWSVAWTPPLPGQYVLGRRAAAAAVKAERFRLDLDRVRVRQEARRVCATWSLASARAEILGAQMEQLASMAEKSRQRAASGEESGLTARRLRLAAAEVRADLATAGAESERAEVEARVWQTDLAAGTRPALPPLPDVPEVPTSAATLEVCALEADRDQARLALRLTRRFWEAPELMVGRQTLTEIGASRTGPVWGVTWSVPLFARKQPERALAGRRAEIAEARFDLGSRRAQTQVAAASAAYRALLEGVRAIEPDIRQPESLVEAAVASYRAGESTVTDLLDTLAGVRSASLRWLELYGEAHAAHRALELALGQSEGDRK
jgi:outer membrane protein TolC